MIHPAVRAYSLSLHPIGGFDRPNRWYLFHIAVIAKREKHTRDRHPILRNHPAVRRGGCRAPSAPPMLEFRARSSKAC